MLADQIAAVCSPCGGTYSYGESAVHSVLAAAECCRRFVKSAITEPAPMREYESSGMALAK
jgi:hypothetical protein